MEADWAQIASVLGQVALVLAGGAVGVITQQLHRRGSRQDKRTELIEARTDRHGDALRLAYSEFIAAAATAMNRATEWIIAEGTTAEIEAEIQKLGDTAPAAAGALLQALRDKGRNARDLFLVTAANAEQKAVNVLLLETRDEARAEVIAIGMEPLALPASLTHQSIAEDASLQADLTMRRTRIDALARTLAGTFAPGGVQLPRLSLSEVVKRAIGPAKD